VARFHPQGQVDEGCHKVLRCNEKKKKKSYSFGRLKKIKNFFFLGKKLMMNLHIIKCIWSTEKIQGVYGKQKLLKTCGVASVVSTTKMKKGFTESSIKKGCEL
jgi:hypothetical protein